MFYENRLGIKKSVMSLFTCFVRIPARNSVSPIIHITGFPTVNFEKKRFSINYDQIGTSKIRGETIQDLDETAHYDLRCLQR